MNSKLTKEKARNCRMKGHSLKEISDRFSIAKSTASLWTSDVILSADGIKRVVEMRDFHRAKGHAILHERKLARFRLAEDEAQKKFDLIQRYDHFPIVILAMLYQCEGSKRDVSICFTNADPRVIKLFMFVLRSSFEIDENKLRGLVHIHDYHNEKEILQFWSNITGIPLKRFNRSFRKKSTHINKKEGYKGCLHVYYHDSRVTRILQAFAKKLINFYI